MKKAIVCGIAALALATTASAQVFNELYISHTGTDDQEFIEICAQPNEDLSALVVLVLEGDESSNEGTIDRVYALGTTDANGFYVLGDDAVAAKDVSIGASNTLENGSGTFLIVSGFTGALGDDVDADDDGVAEVGVGTIVASHGRSDGGANDKVYYGALVGPMDGTFSAPGVARCDDCTGPLTQLLCFDDNEGAFDLCDVNADVYANPTPKAANNCPGTTGTEEANWGEVKSMFR